MARKKKSEPEKPEGDEPEKVIEPEFIPVMGTIIATDVRTAGRPSGYTKATGELICELTADGLSLLDICAREEMPNRSTVRKWLIAHEEFAAMYARAREAQADHYDAEIARLTKSINPFNAQAIRVAIDAIKWRMGKLRPRAYGDKVQLSDADGNNLPTPFFTIIPGKAGEKSE